MCRLACLVRGVAIPALRPRVAAACAADASAAVALGQGITDLGVLPGGDHPFPRSVSQDGSVVAGWYRIDGGSSRPFRWIGAAGVQEVPSLPRGADMIANAAPPASTSVTVGGTNLDGSVIVGHARVAGMCRASRWGWSIGGGAWALCFQNTFAAGCP